MEIKRIRGFEICKDKYAKLPIRSTSKSAGYDFFINEDIKIKPKETLLIWTNVKAYMLDDEFLDMYIRSSVGSKNRIRLTCSGLIDSDYYNNPRNDGNIGLAFENLGTETFVMKKGDRIAQGVFKKYLIADNDDCKKVRNGGFGSTGI